MCRPNCIAPLLTVEPQRVLVDEPVSIRADGYVAGETVGIRARMVDGYGVTWESAAAYGADRNGAVDLATEPAKEAGDGVADAMRLIWSMRPAGQSPSMVYRAPPDLADEVVRFEVSDRRGRTAGASVTRVHLAPDVERIEIAEAGVVGTLFVPAGRRHGPAIVVLSTSTGGVDERAAALYAAHGYTALALAYFNDRGLPPVLAYIPLEYVRNALGWLSALECVDGDRIAVTGRSRGGELALLLGATFPEIRCVLADVASGLIWEGYGVDSERPAAAWTYGGKPLPFLSRRAYAALERQSQSGAGSWSEEQFLEETGIGAAELRRCEIAVEKTNGGILLVSAGDDRVWPSAILSQIAERRLADSGFGHAFEHASYRAAGHYVIAPYTPTTVTTVTHPVTGETYSLGGTAEGTYAASVDAWRRKLAFLEANVGAGRRCNEQNKPRNTRK